MFYSTWYAPSKIFFLDSEANFLPESSPLRQRSGCRAGYCGHQRAFGEELKVVWSDERAADSWAAVVA
jgi:hypothetical protein